MQPIGLPSSTPGSIRTRVQKRAPTPTNPAYLLGRAAFGETNCAYLNGNPQLPLNCASGYDCTHDGTASVSGCCATTGGQCNLQTTCIDYGATSAGVARALTCDEEKPFCTTGIFVDGYAMFTCGSEDKRTQVSAFYHSSGPAASAVATRSQSSSSLATPGQSSSNGNGGDDTSTPLTTVVGAVIGGIAVTLIAVFFIWFVIRIKRKDRATHPIPSPPASVIEMVRPPTISDSRSELHVEEKKMPTYSEMEVPPLRYAELQDAPKPKPELSGIDTQKSIPELSGRDSRCVYEVPGSSAKDSTSGRSELP